MSLPLTPSDRKDFQDKHSIKPEDGFIVMFSSEHKKSAQTLKDVFNKHGKGKVTASLQSTFFVKDMSWGIINELRNHPDVTACGPESRGGPC